MRYLRKLYNATIGFYLLLKYERLFDFSLFTGKRIAVVGPASSAFNTGRGSYIDRFDFVVRLNKAPFQLRESKFTADIGSKTDVLFHSFFENEFSGGGPLDFELYNRMGIRYVINPIPTYFGKRLTFNFYKKYLLPRPVYTVSRSLYENLVRPFGKYRPTTGFCALYYMMNAEFEELFITGFTFFKTPYGDGYRDDLKDVEVNMKYIGESGIHNPDVEYNQFKMLLRKNHRKMIVTDRTLREILEKDGLMLKEAIVG